MLGLGVTNPTETYIRFPVMLLSLARLCGDSFPIQRALVSGDACPKGVMEELLGSGRYPHYGSRECGELVFTTIGADAMPLIRYRTGDYTRILPLCRYGGVTRRIDRVSVREGEISIEELDSVPFTIPCLVDDRSDRLPKDPRRDKKAAGPVQWAGRNKEGKRKRMVIQIRKERLPAGIASATKSRPELR